MRSRTLFSGAILALACAHAVADLKPGTATIYLGGAKIGTSTLTLAEGKFKSSTQYNIGPQTVSSTMTGRLSDGKFVEFFLEEESVPVKGSVTYAKGAFTAATNGKTVVDKFKTAWDERTMFSTNHPLLADNIMSTYVAGKMSATIKLFNPNALAVQSFAVSYSAGRATFGGNAIATDKLELKVGGIGLDYVFSPEGTALGFRVPSQNFMMVRDDASDLFADPFAKYPFLSQPTYKSPVTKSNVRVKMTDGVELAADVMLPDEVGKFPVVLVRSPYGRTASMVMLTFLAQRGYVVVSQDVRGRGDSAGGWDPLVHEVSDGKDTLDWLASQPWCDGNVGMIGGSYLGYTQWAAAKTHHPLLKCIVPQVSPPDPLHNFPWDHGAFMLMSNVWWSGVVRTKDTDMAVAMSKVSNLEAINQKPITKIDEGIFGANVPFYDNWTRRRTISDWGNVYSIDDVANVKIPALHVSGKWDGDGIGTKLHWEVRKKAGRPQWLIFGPWDHIFNSKSRINDQEYGAKALLDLDPVYLHFFDTYLKGKETKWASEPKVQFFITGKNDWVKGTDWPLTSAKPTSLYLTGSSSNGAASKGRLVASAGSTHSASYRYDPNKVKIDAKELKVMTNEGSFELKRKDIRADQLLFKTAAFGTDTIVTGPVDVDLFVSTSGKDATFHALLCDEAPNGKMSLIALQGTMRMNWTPSGIKPVVPGKVTQLRVRPWEFGHRFAKGHKLVLIVTSNLFPNFARNPGTGESEATATKYIATTQKVYMGKGYPSRIRFYTLPGS